MQKVIALLLLSFSLTAYSQSSNLSGEVHDESGSPLPSSTVVLLHPLDSTMQYFSITGSKGNFEIKGIRKGNYLLQAAFIGHQSYYKNISMPYGEDGVIEAIQLEANAEQLEGVQVTAERIPLKVNQDTLEYDVKAYKTAPDDNVEELLKKLPGIEVDRAGNIKALGEDVTNVLVDGKEFFSNDPKVATKNLPADALDKVQLYNKKTEEAEFTGIDDGERNQTLNLILNEKNKDGVFGEIMAGGGTGKHYDAKAKVYKFTDKSQIAALGMMNNINKFGFSFGDYISFTGGISNISHGKGGISMDGSFPINFGQAINGLSSSGAAGLNYSYYKSKYQRIFVSYLGSGSKKELSEQSDTWRYKEDASYFEENETERVNHDTAHNLTFGARWLFLESNNLIVNGGASFNTAYIPLSSSLSNYANDVIVNDLTRVSTDLSNRLSGNMNATYLKKINEGSTLVKLTGNTFYSSDNSETDFNNTARFYESGLTNIVDQFQDNAIKTFSYGAALSLTQKIAGAVYLDMAVSASNADQSMDRVQGNASPLALIDSLSPEFLKVNQSIKPSLSIRRNTEKMTFTAGVDYNMGRYSTTLDSDVAILTPYKFLQPKLSWQYRYKTGRRLSFKYSSRANTPSANQLLPVVNNFNSFSLFYGNRNLSPEYIHSVYANWWIFDEFSFTSFLFGLRSSYTNNKINYSRSVNDQLEQVVQLVNVDNDFMVNGNIDFSTPIRALGIKANLDISESYNKGINIVDGLDNELSGFNHKYSLSFDNRKKDKWDINTGVGLSITDTKYSIQDMLNNVYFDMSWFGEIRYNPSDKLDFFFSADVTNYTAQSFEEAQLVPLLGAHVSYSFAKNNRMTLTLAGHDLLNKNIGISRIAEENYLEEKTSNIIGRYFMLTLKYRLNKFGGDTGMKVNIKKR